MFQPEATFWVSGRPGQEFDWLSWLVYSALHFVDDHCWSPAAFRLFGSRQVHIVEIHVWQVISRLVWKKNIYMIYCKYEKNIYIHFSEPWQPTMVANIFHCHFSITVCCCDPWWQNSVTWRTEEIHVCSCFTLVWPSAILQDTYAVESSCRVEEANTSKSI